MNTITIKLPNGHEETATTEEWVAAILCVLPSEIRDAVIARAGQAAKGGLAVPTPGKGPGGLVLLS